MRLDSAGLSSALPGADAGETSTCGLVGSPATTPEECLRGRYGGRDGRGDVSGRHAFHVDVPDVLDEGLVYRSTLDDIGRYHVRNPVVLRQKAAELRNPLDSAPAGRREFVCHDEQVSRH